MLLRLRSFKEKKLHLSVFQDNFCCLFSSSLMLFSTIPNLLSFINKLFIKFSILIFNSKIYNWFCFIVLISLLRAPICSLSMCTCTFKSFNIIIISLLKSLSANSNTVLFFGLFLLNVIFFNYESHFPVFLYI